jgi:transposase
MEQIEILETIVTRACGLDVHKDTIKACIMRQGIEKLIQTFGTTTDDLLGLKSWLKENDISHISIESTGVFWKPVFNILGDEFEIILVNARHVKHVPGKKTDVLDCEWLCRLLRAGLLKGSFIPKEYIRQLRDLNRYQKKQQEELIREKNRVQKILQDCNIKLSSVLSDVFGKAGWKILEMLISGVTDIEKLVEPFLGNKILRKKAEEACKALKGKLNATHRLMLQTQMGHIRFIEKQMGRIEWQINQIANNYKADIANLMTMHGISQKSANAIIAEIGTNMEVFPSERHITSWAGLCPGNNESAGKNKKSRTRNGNKYLKSLMVECAWCAIKTKGSYFRAKYYSLVPRMGKKKAIVAIARKMLVYCYFILKNKVPYYDLGEGYILPAKQKEKIAKSLIKRLSNMGFQVIEKKLVPEPDFA